MKASLCLALLMALPLSLHAEEKLSCTQIEKLGKTNKATGITPNRDVSVEMTIEKNGDIRKIYVISSRASGEEAGGGVCELDIPGDKSQKVSKRTSNGRIEYSIKNEFSDSPSKVLITKVTEGYLIDLTNVEQSVYCGALSEFPEKVLLKNNSKLCKATYP